MRRIFENKELEKSITQNGYAVVENFLSADIVDELTIFFENNDNVDNRPFSISNWNSNISHRSSVYNTIVNSICPNAQKIVIDYKPVMGVFAFKRPGINSEMVLHQDWSLVDETTFRSISFWVALCDMDNVNGNLQVVNRSHLYAGHPRGMNLPVPFESIKTEIQDNFLTDIPVKKGDAIVFDHRLIHCSPPNRSKSIRVAAVLSLIPNEAELIHYYSPFGIKSNIEVLKIKQEEFYLLDFFNIHERPKNDGVLATLPWPNEILSFDDLRKAMTKYN